MKTTMNLNKILFGIGIIIILISVFLVFTSDDEVINDTKDLNTEGLVEINYFWSATCPYCRMQNKFWEDFTEKYPDVILNKYSIDNQNNLPLFQKIAKEHGAERYAGVVPITFVGNRFFVGFDGPEKIGREIENAVILETERLKLEEIEE